MSTHEQSRRAHELVDAIKDGYTPDRADVDFLRSFLPGLPKQKTLAKIIAHVDDAWSVASGNDWGGNSYNPNISIEDWLTELHAQLQGLKDTPATEPALPAGMRLADHEKYGRVITSPKPNRDGVYDLLVPRPKFETGADWEYAHECELTFIDAKPAHPEFLETEADYRDAPEGTIVACEDSPPWHKFDSEWLSTAAYEGNNAKNMTGIIRRVLRWGDGE